MIDMFELEKVIIDAANLMFLAQLRHDQIRGDQMLRCEAILVQHNREDLPAACADLRRLRPPADPVLATVAVVALGGRVVARARLALRVALRPARAPRPTRRPSAAPASWLARYDGCTRCIEAGLR